MGGGGLVKVGLVVGYKFIILDEVDVMMNIV